MKQANREQVVDEVSNWIDTTVIAEMVVSHLEDQGEEVTIENAKNCWLGTLENLGSGTGIALSCGESATL